MTNGSGNGNGVGTHTLGGRKSGDPIDPHDPGAISSAEGWANRPRVIHPPSAPAIADSIDHPDHYRQHPSGVECIAIVEHMSFNVGSAIKYLWRAGLKTPDPIEDLRKAEWFCRREIARLSGASGAPADPDE